MSEGQPHQPPNSQHSRRRPAKPSMRLKDGRKQPFVWFPDELLPLYGAAMGAYAGWVYMSLLTHLNRQQGRCYLSHETIATETGMSIAQVKVSLKKLEALGLIGITMRRPKVSIYEVFDLPERPANRQDMPIDTDGSNSQQVAINSQQVAINSQDMAIEQLVGSYEPEVVVPEDEVQKTIPPPPTPSVEIMAPKSTDVVEVVGDFAIATGEETTATAGSIADAMAPTPFDAFYVAYPHHKAIRKANAEWDRQQLDSTLPDILQALAVTSIAKLPEWPHVYLQNKGWLDARPVAASAQTHVWKVDFNGNKIGPVDPDAPRCKVADCHESPQALSEKRCDTHARQYIRRTAQELWDIAYQERPANAIAHLHKVLSQCHPTEADRFMATINWDWPQTVDSLAEIIEHVQREVIAEAKVDQRLPDAAENILAVVRAQREYGGLNLEKMIQDILSRSYVYGVIESLPWQEWQSCPVYEIPTVAALVDLMRAALGRPRQEVSA